MYRWHESGCRRPDVSAASGLPTCSYCFAIPSTEDVLPSPHLPQLEDRSRMNLTWPPTVTYRDSRSGKATEAIPSAHGRPQPAKSLLPELSYEDSIRLVRLKPGTGESPIHADYEIVRINQIPLTLYEALSYTSIINRADAFETCPVYLGSYWDVTYVSVNCGDALRRLRRHKGDRLLWVDSLCIDHANPEEKNSQVHILREVYARATKVLAYIGNESPEAALMARELELVCGSLSARWPRRPFGSSCPDLNIPSWLFKDTQWFPFTGSDLLKILVSASQYRCSDPRDKVFALLGLMGEKYISPEYRIPVENVYLGITAYLLKNWNTFDLPSWVPDWSQTLSLPSLDEFRCTKNDRNDPDDVTLDGSTRIKFKDFSRSDCEVEVDSATGAIQLRGLKLYKVSGETISAKEYTHIRVSLGDMGSLIFSTPFHNYEISERDELYLLHGYNHPVILRQSLATGSYTIVSACTVSLGCPSSKFLIPWYRRMRILAPTPNSLTVSALTQDEEISIQQLYSRLNSTDSPNVITARARALSFLMLGHTGIQRIEKNLRVDWDKWNRELGWMFRDQSAIWQYLVETTKLSTDERCGEEHMNTRGPDRYAVGKQFPAHYNWDLTRFCWGFLQPTDSQSETEVQWSPMVDHIRSHRSEIQQWAQVTEQILRVFEYSAAALGEEWTTFPGVQLPQSWASNYERFQAASALSSDLDEGPQQQQRPHLGPECLWSIADFERQLRAREEIWNLRSVDERRGGESNIETHALLSHLGLDLYSEQDIKIV
ncbi:hypothetical protein BJX64DRAFT_274059 [Aspergillus heterothallicus]